MTKWVTVVLTSLILTSALFAQYPDQQEIRQKIIEFEKQRFLNQANLLQKEATLTQTQFDVHAYTLNLGLWPSTQLLEGSVIIEGTSLVNSLSHLEIDLLSNMTVDSVIQDQNAVNYTHTGDIVHIQLPVPINQNETFMLEIFYHGNPQGGGLGTWGWDEHQGVPMIWTLSEPFGAPAWWPCKDVPDDKADSVFLNITVPNNLVVASNGLLTAVTPAGGNRDTYSWETHYPISTYLVSLAITNYAQFSNWYYSASGDSMELTYYVYPEHLTAAQQDFSVTPNMISAFAPLFGEYPFIEEKYGMAIFPWGGAMEHQTMTSYGAPLVTGGHHFDYINAHELAHQWFGDYITMKRWSHIWMNEGFASYSEALWEEHLYGMSAYHSYLNGQDPGSFQGSLWVEDSTNVNALFSRTVYDKGSWALHMLRGVLGDSLFFASLKTYATHPDLVFGNALTEDFQRICETVSGRDLEWYFQQWVYRPGRPYYVYGWDTTGSMPPYTTNLSIIQANAEPYKMPLQICLSDNSQDTTFTVWDSLSAQDFQFSTNFLPTDVQLDPDNWVLKHTAEGTIYSVSGQVLDIADSTGVPEALVIWEGPIDQTTGAPLNAGIDTADASGNFELSLISGDYAIAAVKDSFLISLTKFLDVDGIVSNMTFLLSQPEAMHNPDSIYVALQQNQTRDTLLEVANIATGDLFVEAVEGNFVNTTSLPVGNSFRHQQLPITDLLKKRVAPSYATDNPPDSLWKQIHHDRQENSQNIYDLKDTFYQRDGNRFYLKLTTHVIPAPFTDFRINVFLDTDNNGLTGPNIFGLGTDYLIAVGNLGGGFNGYLLRWNAVSQQFEFVDFVDDFNMYPPSKSVTIGVDEVNIGNPDFVKVYISAFNSNNLAATMDYVPSSNLGYLSAALTDVSWLHLSPLFDLANADSSAALAITIDPQNITGGSYLSGLTIYSSHAGEMRQDFLPIRLDYTTGIAGNQPALPQRFEVGQNYPNPFNPNTEVQFGLPSDSRVKIEIFNILGQRIFLRETPQLSAGYHTFQWNGTDSQGNRVSSGVYFYKISNDDKAKVRKMILMR